jgi:Protein of unknown function (DUF1800)
MSSRTSSGATATRRGLLAGGAAVAGVAAAASPATASGRYRPRTYATRTLLSGRDRHLVSRFSYGLTPQLAAEVRKKGGARAWFAWQLTPGKINDKAGDRTRAWWPELAQGPLTLWQNHEGGIRGGWLVMEDYQRWVMLRRTTSRRQVLETMTQFWENHLNVPTNGEQWFLYRKAYGDVVRRHALGRFDELLHATITHPAMLIYLDNATSSADHPNENLGRELLELHTVGRGNFSEADVKDSARILTGWYVDMWKSWKASYRPDLHATGRVQVKGFSDANSSPDGQRVTADYLRFLAHHPDTAQRLAHKLAVKFVGDDPSPALVRRLAKVYLRSDTAIRPVLEALVESPEFRRSVGDKLRDPAEDVVATYRALRVRVGRPRSSGSAANAMLWQAATIGAMPFSWPRPDGTPLDNATWSSTSRLLASLRTHYTMAGGWWPTEDVDYRAAKAWVPKSGMRFDQLVDHLSRELLHQPSTSVLLKACCEATNLRPGEKITHDHPLVRWSMARLLTTLLDSPEFFSR